MRFSNTAVGRRLPNLLIKFGHIVGAYKLRLLGGRLGADALIYPSARIYQPAKVVIGSRSSVGDFSVLWGGGGITIGNDTMISTHCAIVSLSHDVNAATLGKLYNETTIRNPICIGSNVWIGAHVTVLPGVTIGDNAVVGAGSVVTRDIPPGVIARGVPAVCYARPVRAAA